MGGGGGAGPPPPPPSGGNTFTTSSLNGTWTASGGSGAYTSATNSLSVESVTLTIENASDNSSTCDGTWRIVTDKLDTIDDLGQMTVTNNGSNSWTLKFADSSTGDDIEFILDLSSPSAARCLVDGVFNDVEFNFESNVKKESGSNTQDNSDTQNNNNNNNTNDNLNQNDDTNDQTNNQQDNLNQNQTQDQNQNQTQDNTQDNNNNTGTISIESLNGTWVSTSGSGTGTGTGQYQGQSSPVTVESLTIRIKDASQGSSKCAFSWEIYAPHNFGVFDVDWDDYYENALISNSGSNSWSIHATFADADITYKFTLSSATSATCVISGAFWNEDNPSTTRVNFSVTCQMIKN